VGTPLTALFLVKDEADRLPAALVSVAWADEIVVADTGSTDRTREVAAAHGARVVEIPWEGWVRSRNRALAEASHDWVLFLDADERVTTELAAEIRAEISKPEQPYAGFKLWRLSIYLGRTVRHGTWNPERILRIARRSKGFRVEGPRVHERFVVDGREGRLRGRLLHDTYRDLDHALAKTIQYARLAAEERLDRGVRGSTFGLVVRPVLEFLNSYVLRLGFLDGRAGLGVALLRAMSYGVRAGYLHELAPRPAAGATASTAEET
jgi:glycosyltransferase involved in cell wall biosynthesis